MGLLYRTFLRVREIEMAYKNKEAKKAYMVLYRLNNKDKIINLQKAWANRNPNYFRNYYHSAVKMNCEKSFQLHLKKCLSAAKARAKRHKFDCTIDLENLIALFDYQNGKCAISGIALSRVLELPNTISIDRIDPSDGYVTGNIQLVCQALNYAKWKWNTNTFNKFWDQIKEI